MVEIIEADGEQTYSGNFGDLWPGSSGNYNLNDFTTVNCKKFGGTNSNIIMHSVSNPSTTMSAILGGKWFGDLPSSLTFTGTTLVGGNLTIPAGLTLSVSSGAALQFQSGTKLIVNGMLDIEGTSESNVVIDFETPTMYPDPLSMICAYAGSEVNIEYTEIKNATVGVEAVDCEVHIDHCNFHDNLIPIVFMNSVSDYYGSTITNSYIDDAASEWPSVSLQHLSSP